MLAALASGCAHGSGRGRDGSLRWRYRVEVPAALDELRVELCFPGEPPRRLTIDEADPAAIEAVRELSADGGTARLDREAAVIVLGPLPPGACVRYAVALDPLIEGAASRIVGRHEAVVSLDPRLFLWRPATLYFEADVALDLALAPAVAASVPWEPRGPGSYRLPVTALTWASQVVFGALTKQTVTAAGASFDVTILDGPRKLSEDGVERWLSTAADTVAGLYGRFPTERMQVVVLPFPGGGGPVYFGVALRGGGPSVRLLVSSEAPDHAFPGEWVAIHEFLHHGMPFVGQTEAWLSEGFVTYYTEVLPTRRGFRSEQAGWQSISDGFARGRRDGGAQVLADASRDMHETHNYQRVYWSGAALALLADVALRTASEPARAGDHRGADVTAGEGAGAPRSLDAAMRHLLDCCARSPRIWPADEVLGELDRWAGRPLFSELAGAWLGRAEFPEVAPVYRKLGLDVIDGEVTIRQSAPAADVRRAIFTRPGSK